MWTPGYGWGLSWYLYRAYQRKLRSNPNVSDLVTYIYAPDRGPLLATTVIKATDDKQLTYYALYDTGSE